MIIHLKTSHLSLSVRLSLSLSQEAIQVSRAKEGLIGWKIVIVVVTIFYI